MIALTKRTPPRRAPALVRAYTVDGPMFAAPDGTRTNCPYNSFEAAEAERRRREAQQAWDTMMYNALLVGAAAAGSALTGCGSPGAAVLTRGLLAMTAALFQRKR
ncbi:MAG: hypothetical protein AB1505_20060 [Candidatus Latescibacterota bacterium]